MQGQILASKGGFAALDRLKCPQEVRNGGRDDDAVSRWNQWMFDHSAELLDEGVTLVCPECGGESCYYELPNGERWAWKCTWQPYELLPQGTGYIPSPEVSGSDWERQVDMIKFAAVKLARENGHAAIGGPKLDMLVRRALRLCEGVDDDQIVQAMNSSGLTMPEILHQLDADAWIMCGTLS